MEGGGETPGRHPGHVARAPRDAPGSAPLRRSQLLPQGRRAWPGPPPRRRPPGTQGPAPRTLRGQAPAHTCLRWRTPNRSLGKAAAHRGRMSSPPEDLCPSRGVTVTHARRHCARSRSLAERNAGPERHRVLLATLSPPPSIPRLFRLYPCAGGFVLRRRTFRAMPFFFFL